MKNTLTPSVKNQTPISSIPKVTLTKSEIIDKIIKNHFEVRSDIDKLLKVIEDPDTTQEQYDSICSYITRPKWKNTQKDTHNTNTIAHTLLNTWKATQKQVDLLVKKINGGKDELLTNSTDISYFNGFQHIIYDKYTPSLEALCSTWNYPSLRKTMDLYFTYIRKHNWNSNKTFEEIREFYKQNLVNCQDFKVIKLIASEFPEITIWLTETEKAKIFWNIVSYWKNSLNIEKFLLLENAIFTADDFHKLSTDIQKKEYKDRLTKKQEEFKEQDITDTNSEEEDFKNGNLWKLLSFSDKQKIIWDYLSNTDYLQLPLIRSIVRGLSNNELRIDKIFENNVNILINSGIVPFPTELILNPDPLIIDKIISSITMDYYLYDVEELFIMLKLKWWKNVEIDKIRNKVFNLLKVIGEDENVLHLAVDINEVKDDNEYIKEILNNLIGSNLQYDQETIYSYYLNWLDLDKIRTTCPYFNPPNEATTINTFTWISNINLSKWVFTKAEFIEILNINDINLLSSIFSETNDAWKKTLSSAENYSNFLIALRNNSELKKLFNSSKWLSLDKAFFSDRKINDDIILALKWETFTIEDLKWLNSRIKFPFESIKVDFNNRSSIRDMLSLCNTNSGSAEIIWDTKIISDFIKKISTDDLIYFLWGNPYFSLKNPIFWILVDRFISEASNIESSLKKIALSRIVKTINSFEYDECTITFNDKDKDFQSTKILWLLKLIVSEKIVQPIDFKSITNIDWSDLKIKEIKEFLKYYIDNILINPIYSDFFKKEFEDITRDESITETVMELMDKNYIENSDAKNVWWRILKDIDKEDRSEITDAIASSAEDKASAKLSIDSRNQYVYDDSEFAKERLKNIAEVFKWFPEWTKKKMIDTL